METSAAEQIKELVQKLNEAAKAYYQEDREIMSNREYDALYDQLEKMEKETGRIPYQFIQFRPFISTYFPILSTFQAVQCKIHDTDTGFFQ